MTTILEHIGPTLKALAADLAAGRTTAEVLVKGCLDRIAARDGEGARVYLRVMADEALAAARAVDIARSQGRISSPWAGIPVNIKDLFDLAGQVTTAGSRVLANAPPAAADAVAVARLKAAGFIVIGRANMTEFAFSGVGLNPHYGTPLNPWDRAGRRIPGGSSSGGAVAITDGMAYGALGTDTGGSCRIPAALCGITGFKPTQRRVPLAGAYPLSTTLDSAGPLAGSVECCAVLDAVLAGEAADQQSLAPLPPVPLSTLRLGVVRHYVQDGMDEAVSAAYERALQCLSRAGAHVQDIAFEQLAQLPQINSKGGFAAPESWAHHKDLITARGEEYDPRVLSRMLRGWEQDAADYINLHQRRAAFIREATPVIGSVDALLMPTVPVVAPAIDALAGDDDYTRINGLMLRNPSLVNFIDGCAISIPVHEPGCPPVGLTLFTGAMGDRRLLAIAAAAQSVLGY